MAVVNEARAILTAEDRASAVLAMVARNFDKLERAATKLSQVQGDPRRQQVVNTAMERQTVLASRMGAVAARAAGPLAAMFGTYQAAQFVTNANKAFAENERAMTRIAVTADASGEAQQTAWRDLQRLAMETAQPVDKVREGLDALVAAGRSLPDAMAFLPSVARTAQASGASVADIAKSADAVGSAFKIAGADMQEAFDIMATGGKLGQFELKDMARYLPSLAPAAAAIGMEGKKGLTDLVAMLQVLRKGSGTSEEAAGSMNNILQKMSSEETAKRFKKMGVDLEAMFKSGKAAGKDMISIFMEATQAATKGDLGKLPNLINDMEFSRGVRAMMMYRSELERMRQAIATTASGTVAQDLNRVLSNNQATMDRFKIATDRLSDSLGKRLAPAFQATTAAATAAMNAVSGALEPGKTDAELLKETGYGKKTRAEMAIDDAQRAMERQRLLDDPNSEYYSMRDGGFAANPRRHGRRRADPLTLLNEASAARRRQKLEEMEAARRASDRARRDFFASERAGFGADDGRRSDVYDNLDAQRRKDIAIRQEDTMSSAATMAGAHGDASREVMAAMMNLAQIIRAEALGGEGGANVFGMAGAGARDAAMTAIGNALREVFERRADATGKPLDEAALAEAIGALKGLAERIGGAVPLGGEGPKTRVDGLYQGVEEILRGNITAKADLDVTSQVTVKVEPSPDFWAKVEAKIEAKGGRDTRGVSLPGKETTVSGGGFAP